MFKKYGSIGQLKNSLYTMRKMTFEGTVRTFTGRVKVNGTNTCIILTKSKEVILQSNNRIISTGKDGDGNPKDHYGFATWVEENPAVIDTLMSTVHSPDRDTYVYGEFAGGNIQSSVGVIGLDKFFYVFSIVDGEGNKVPKPLLTVPKLLLDADEFIVHIVNVDILNPTECVPEIITKVTEVENECPVALSLGVSGIGEGIVYTCEDEPELMFKAKGSKHTKSKARKIKLPVSAEAMKSIELFGLEYCTEGRLQQAVKELEIDDPMPEDIGQLIKWICSDIIKEESDVMEASGIKPKDLSKVIPQIVKHFVNEIR